MTLMTESQMCAKWMLFDALQYVPTASDIAVAIQTMREVGMNCRTPYHRRCYKVSANRNTNSIRKVLLGGMAGFSS
jgi:hypothetical protein